MTSTRDDPSCAGAPDVPAPTADVPRVVAILVSVAAAGLAMGTTIPLFALLIESRGYGATTAGLNATTGLLATLITAPCVPALTRRSAPVRLILIGAAAVAAGSLVAWAWPGVVVWYLLRIPIGVGIALHWVISEAWMNACAPPHRRGLLVGVYATVLGGGFAVGPWLLSVAGPVSLTAFALPAGLMAIAGGAVWVTRHRLPALAHPTGSGSVSMLARAPAAFAAVAVSGFIEASALSLLAVYAQRAGLPTPAALHLVTATVTGGVLLQVPIGWLAQKWDCRRLLAACAAGTAALTLCAPFVLDTVWARYGLFFVLGGFAIGLYTLALIDLGERFAAAHLAAANATFVTLYCLGSTIGPAVAGGSIDVFGPPGFVASVAVVAAGLAGVLGLWALRSSPPRQRCRCLN